jgi:GWxTD domain-containing protein
VRRSSSSSLTEASARRLARRRVGLALAWILGCAAAPAGAAADAAALFRLITRDGRTYLSYFEPSVKKGYVFLSDEKRNFFSVPLEAVNWEATLRANAEASARLMERWPEGPVRYLLRPALLKEFEALADDAGRAAWISRFWASLDPTPDTFHNERRHAYWSRVHAANLLFKDSTRPGWMTDRGKIYILLGPPDEIESFPSRTGNDARYDPRYTLDAPGGYPRHTIPPRGVTRWIYRNPPGDLDPNTIVAFREDPSGEYHLSDHGMDYDRVFSQRTTLFSVGDDAHPRTRMVFGSGRGEARAEVKAELGRNAIPAASTLSLLGDLGEAQQEALEENWLTGVVRSHEYFGVFPVTSAFHFYRSREGLTYVEINLAVERPAGSGADPSSPLSIGARLVSVRDPSLAIDFPAEDGFMALPDAGAPGGFVFQSGTGVPPGDYQLLVAVSDPDTGQVGSWRESVEVPDLWGPGLVLSDLVLASRVEAAPSPPSSSLKQPFLHGRLRIVPDIDGKFSAGAELGFYYQVYGATAGPVDGKPRLDLEYRIERLDAAGAAAEPMGGSVALEGQRDPTQAFSFPLTQWPAGSYRLTVRVTDRLASVSAERRAEFRVVP